MLMQFTEKNLRGQKAAKELIWQWFFPAANLTWIAQARGYCRALYQLLHGAYTAIAQLLHGSCTALVRPFTGFTKALEKLSMRSPKA